MADLKNALFTYLAHRHFDLMPPDVRARFDEYADNGSFVGNMKQWNTRFAGTPIVPLTTTMTNLADWEKLYRACQQTFQKMDASKAPSFGYGGEYNGATKDFIAEWFGDTTKTFTTSRATGTSVGVFNSLETWLTTHKASLLVPFKTHLSSIFSDTAAFDKFVKNIHDKKYNTSKDFRDQLETVIEYIDYYQTNPDPTQLPTTIPHVTLTGLDPDPNRWYEIPDFANRVTQFKTDYVRIFDTLLTDATIRKHFLAKADSPIKEVLETAIAKTDYENKDSDDYLPPMPIDSKNWRQKIKKWADDTYENHFRRFTNPSRGTRLYFSPYSQNIMKAFDKAGIKPTDGIDGILSKKDDAKLKSVIDQDPTTRKHFEWFTKKMETIKKEMPNAYNEALRKGNQLREVVIRIITTTKKEDVEKAKTALEVLSVAKYGLSSSRTFDAIHKATKDLKVFSDEKLSWNKNEGMKFVSKAIDKTAAFMVNTAALASAGIHNFVQHRKTKINKYIGRYKNLNDPYKKWVTEDTTKHGNLVASNAAHNVTGKLTDLNNPTRPIVPPYQTQVQINDTTITGIRTALNAALSAGAATVTVPITGAVVNTTDLQNDVEIFEDAYARQQHDVNWRRENPDVIHDLVAYWNMLESTTRTHAFTLGSMSVKRKAMLEDYSRGTSNAQNIAEAYRQSFGTLSYT